MLSELRRQQKRRAVDLIRGVGIRVPRWEVEHSSPPVLLGIPWQRNPIAAVSLERPLGCQSEDFQRLNARQSPAYLAVLGIVVDDTVLASVSLAY